MARKYRHLDTDWKQHVSVLAKKERDKAKKAAKEAKCKPTTPTTAA
jgi:hypothetical protein